MPDSRPSVSFEFFPPKDESGVDQLWNSIKALEKYAPDFVSVTYGAGGSTRERTIAIACEIFERTGYRTIAHLTCVGSTRSELQEILEQYRQANIHDVLALRGDPVGGPSSEWTPTPAGLNHADELVQLAMEMGGFNIGVAAFPDGHPASNHDLEKDLQVLLNKERLGATFAITQFVFDCDKYLKLTQALKEAGSKLIVYPGIMPVTSFKQISRMLELSGGAMPPAMMAKFEAVASDAQATRELGIDIAATICRDLYLAGATGFHFYTLNNSQSTQQVLDELVDLFPSL